MPTASDSNRCTCLKCAYEWRPSSEVLPKVCPRCKSYTWNEPRKRGFNKKAMIGKTAESKAV